MSTQTTNLGLTKPAGNERPLVGVLNDNMDIIDDAVGDNASAISALQILEQRCTTVSVQATSYTYTSSPPTFELVIATSGTHIAMFFVEFYTSATYVKEVADPDSYFTISTANKEITIGSTGIIGTVLRFRLNN